MIELKDFDLVMGRITVEAIDDDIEQYEREKAGLSKDSKLVVVTEAYKQLYKIPIHRGKVLKIGATSFGERFEKWYGTDTAEECRKIKPGDVVMFVPNQGFALDPEKKVHILKDEDVLGYVKAEDIK